MKLHLVSFKQFVSFSFLLFYSANVVSADDNRLWLPKKYQHHYVAMLQSVTAAEALNRCVEVLEGTIDIGQSQPEHPIFRILCRQSNKRSYVEMVDGVSFATLTTQEYPPLESMQRRQASFAALCYRKLAKETALMLGMELVGEPMREPISLDENLAVFTYDFNAADAMGVPLSYRAKCTVTPAEKVVVKIRPRKNSE